MDNYKILGPNDLIEVGDEGSYSRNDGKESWQVISSAYAGKKAELFGDFKIRRKVATNYRPTPIPGYRWSKKGEIKQPDWLLSSGKPSGNFWNGSLVPKDWSDHDTKGFMVPWPEDPRLVKNYVTPAKEPKYGEQAPSSMKGPNLMPGGYKPIEPTCQEQYGEEFES